MFWKLMTKVFVEQPLLHQVCLQDTIVAFHSHMFATGATVLDAKTRYNDKIPATILDYFVI